MRGWWGPRALRPDPCPDPPLPSAVVCGTSKNLQGSAAHRFTKLLQQTLSGELLVDGSFCLPSGFSACVPSAPALLTLTLAQQEWAGSPWGPGEPQGDLQPAPSSLLLTLVLLSILWSPLSFLFLLLLGLTLALGACLAESEEPSRWRTP